MTYGRPPPKGRLYSAEGRGDGCTGKKKHVIKSALGKKQKSTLT